MKQLVVKGADSLAGEALPMRADDKHMPSIKQAGEATQESMGNSTVQTMAGRTERDSGREGADKRADRGDQLPVLVDRSSAFLGCAVCFWILRVVPHSCLASCFH